MARPTKPINRKPINRLSRISSAVKKSWRDPAVAAARRKRYAVKVDGVLHGSVAKAVEALGMEPKHILKLRATLLERPSRRAKYEGRSFTLIEK